MMLSGCESRVFELILLVACPDDNRRGSNCTAETDHDREKKQDEIGNSLGGIFLPEHLADPFRETFRSLRDVADSVHCVAYLRECVPACNRDRAKIPADKGNCQRVDPDAQAGAEHGEDDDQVRQIKDVLRDDLCFRRGHFHLEQGYRQGFEQMQIMHDHGDDADIDDKETTGRHNRAAPHHEAHPAGQFFFFGPIAADCRGIPERNSERQKQISKQYEHEIFSFDWMFSAYNAGVPRMG